MSYNKGSYLDKQVGLSRQKGRVRVKHKQIYDGLYYTHKDLLSLYSSIISRCHNKYNTSYINYGARGITVYGPWRVNRKLFVEYIEGKLGPKPKNYSLDRIDNNKGYKPGNLRWASWTTQANNRRNSKL